METAHVAHETLNLSCTAAGQKRALVSPDAQDGKKSRDWWHVWQKWKEETEHVSAEWEDCTTEEEGQLTDLLF